MALGDLVFDTDALILLILSVITVVLITLTIFIKDKLEKRKEVFQPPQLSWMKSEVKMIRKLNADNSTKLDKIDSLARELFKEKFNISKKLDYFEVKDILNSKNSPEGFEFCEKMIDSLYSGNEITDAKITELIFDLYNLIGVEERRNLAKVAESGLTVNKLESTVDVGPGNFSGSTKRKMEFVKKTVEIKRKPSAKAKSKEKFIHSIDVLDRIKHKSHKLKKHK